MKRISCSAILLFFVLCDAVGGVDVGRNITVTPTGSENEPAMAINPLDPSNVAIATIRWILVPDTQFYLPKVVVYYSHDSGITWSQSQAFANPNTTLFNSSADPWLAFDHKGMLHVGLVWFKDDVGSGSRIRSNPSIYAYYSNDGGISFSSARQIALASGYGTSDYIFYHKPAIVAEVDPLLPANQARVYLVYTKEKPNVSPTQSSIELAISQDGGNTYAVGNPVEAPGTAGEWRIGAVPAVGPNRKLYVGWYERLATGGKMRMAVSTDLGTTFPIKQDAATNVVQVPNDALSPDGFKVYPIPSIAVDTTGGPTTGKIYLAWAEWAGSDADIKMIVGTPNGDNTVTWTTRYRVNNDSQGNGKDQFFPAVIVSPDGVPAVLFLDERADTTYSRKYHAYIGEPNSDFTAFTNTKISEVQSDPKDAFRTGPSEPLFGGDYISISATSSSLTSLKSVAIWPKSTPSDDTHRVIAASSQYGEVQIPQIVDGGGYRTTFLIANLDSTSSTSFQLQLYNQAGQALAVLPGNVSYVAATISARGLHKIQTVGGAQTQIGWARITTTSSARTSSAALVQLFSGTTVLAQAGLSATNAVSSSFLHTPYNAASGVNSGIAVANPGSDTITVEMTLYNDQGSALDTESRSLGSNQQFSLQVSDLFPGIPSPSQASVELTAFKQGFPTQKRGVAIWTTRVDSALAQFTWFPGITRKSTPEAGYAQVANGGGYRTTFRFTNRSSQHSSQGRLELFTPSGNPWNVFPGNVNYLDVSLSPKSSASYQTVGGATAAGGWARFLSDNGFIGAPEVIQTFNGRNQVTNEAGSSPFPYYSRCLVPATWDQNAGINTGISLALKDETGVQATVDLILYDTSGQQLGSTQTQPLGGSYPTQVVKNLNEWFPGVTGPVTGTVQVKVRHGSGDVDRYVTVAAIRTDGVQWATYPVLF